MGDASITRIAVAEFVPHREETATDAGAAQFLAADADRAAIARWDETLCRLAACAGVDVGVEGPGRGD